MKIYELIKITVVWFDEDIVAQSGPFCGNDDFVED